MCDPASLPTDYQDVLDLYTSKGYRVIALASKNIDVEDNDDLKTKPRDFYEKDLNFLGILVMENKLKAETQ